MVGLRAQCQRSALLSEGTISHFENLEKQPHAALKEYNRRGVTTQVHWDEQRRLFRRQHRVTMRLVVGMMFAFAGAAVGQTSPSAPAFDAISIKPSPPPGQSIILGMFGGPGTKDPTLVRAQNYSVLNMLETAYDMDFYRIIGPEWIGTIHFDIVARVPPSAAKEQFHMMLQNMLVERFRLVTHREKRQTKAYELVAAKNGPRLKPSAKAVTRLAPTGRRRRRFPETCEPCIGWTPTASPSSPAWHSEKRPGQRAHARADAE